MLFVKAELSDLPYIYSQMEMNFIHDEIRDYEDAVKVFSNKKYSIYILHEKSFIVGFMCVWALSTFSFLEHFVIYDEYRCQGYGGKALELLKKEFGTVILECEPAETDEQIRRMDFYMRHGMIKNEADYWQPSYRKNGGRCYLKLMSSEKLCNFNETVKEIYREVYQIYDV